MNNQVLDSTQLQAFAKMTNSEFDTWWTDNVTDTASAIQTMKQLAEVIRPLIPIKPDEILDNI